MKNKLTTTLIVVLVLLNVGSFAYSYAGSKQTADLRNSIESLPKEPIIYIGQDGHTPIAGIDYRIPENGKDGINSVSFSKTEVVVKEVPLIGEIGKSAYDIWLDKGNVGTEDDFIASLKGVDAPYQQLRVNPDNLNIQSKLSNWDVWTTLVKCDDYRLECPSGN